MNGEVLKFKKLLEWFVRQLRINNDIIPGKKVSGQGYKSDAIKNSYVQWREYDGFTLDISMQLGFQKDTKANYIHCTQTWMNIVPIFYKSMGKSVVTKLQIVYKPEQKVIAEGAQYTIDELGLFDEKEPNDTLKKFFNGFLFAVRQL